MNAIENFLKMKQELLELFTEEELKEELEKRKSQNPERKPILHLLGRSYCDTEHFIARYGLHRR